MSQVPEVGSVEYSIIGPAMNEAGNLEEYVERCFKGLEAAGVTGEVVIIDDGSTDGTGAVLQTLVTKYPGRVRGFSHRRNMGLTQALKTGFENARGDYLLWISSDLEAHPDEDIPLFVESFREGAVVVAGARLGRGDGKNVASGVYNKVCKFLFDIRLRDMNWMKGFRRECLEFLELRGEWHRFILVMLHMAGFNIVEKDMQWYPRRYGVSKFGLMRFPGSFVDAISIWFMTIFSRRPMRLFGTIGGLSGILGIMIHIGLVALYLAEQTQIRPLFWAAIGLELFAVQMVMFGFLAELIERVRDEAESEYRARGRGAVFAVELKPGETPQAAVREEV